MKKTENGYPYYEEDDDIELDTYTKELTQNIEEKTGKTPVYEGIWDKNKVYKKHSIVVYEKDVFIASVDIIPAGTLPTNKDFYELYIDNSTPISLEEKVKKIEETLGDINSILDCINGEIVGDILTENDLINNTNFENEGGIEDVNE